MIFKKTIKRKRFKTCLYLACYFQNLDMDARGEAQLNFFFSYAGKLPSNLEYFKKRAASIHFILLFPVLLILLCSYTNSPIWFYIFIVS